MKDPCQPIVILHLKEYEHLGKKYVRCVDDNDAYQKQLLSHLLNGGVGATSESFPVVQQLAAAHGWAVHLKLLPPKEEEEPTKAERFICKHCGFIQTAEAGFNRCSSCHYTHMKPIL